MHATIGKEINYAAKLLKKDQIVAIPTETVYGLAGNGCKASVLAKIFAIKARPLFDPLILHGHSLAALMPYITDLPREAERLAERFWPGPLTLVLPKSKKVPDLATAGQDSVAIRIPAHPSTRQLLQQLPFPLAAPSANPFQAISPTTAQHVAYGLGNKIPYILDGGPTQRGLESTIVGFINDQPQIYRLGSLPIEEIEECLSKDIPLLNQNSKTISLPGMEKRHYAPNKPFFVGEVDQLLIEHTKRRVGLLTLENHPAEGVHIVAREVLSAKGDLTEAAQNFFQKMHRLNQNKEVEVILASCLPEKGLGKAINDRLQRAASK